MVIWWWWSWQFVPYWREYVIIIDKYVATCRRRSVSSSWETVLIVRYNRYLWQSSTKTRDIGLFFNYHLLAERTLFIHFTTLYSIYSNLFLFGWESLYLILFVTMVRMYLNWKSIQILFGQIHKLERCARKIQRQSNISINNWHESTVRDPARWKTAL